MPLQKRKKKQFQNCLPHTKGACTNILSFSKANDKQSIHNYASIPSDAQNSDLCAPLSFIDQKMIQAYGVPLTNTEGEWKNDMWENIWKRIVNLSRKLCTLPGGAIGRQFVSLLTAEFLGVHLFFHTKTSHGSLLRNFQYRLLYTLYIQSV